MRWEVLNHALVAKGNPKTYKNIDYSSIKENIKQNKALFARWTEEFDSKMYKDWWYVLIDAPFDISALKSNTRYKINKGRKLFDVKVIDPMKFKEELYNLQIAALSAYPEKYRPHIDKKQFIDGIEGWSRFKKIYGAFSVEDGSLRGYMRFLELDEKCLELSTLKSDPAYEKYQINAAIIDYALDDCRSFLESGGMIIDGERTISHETSFQNYLESYFGFRKAYCKLNIMYSPLVGIAVKVLYPFRTIISKSNQALMNNISSVLKMEEILRKQRECV